MVCENKIKLFKTSLNNKNSISLSHPYFIFCPKNGGVIIAFSFMLLALKKG